MKEPNVYSFFDECYVYYGDYAKNIEKLKERVKEWQDIATRINEDNNKLNSIIKEAREYMNNLRWFEMVSNDVDMTLYASTKDFWHDISGILDKAEENK